MEQVLVKDKGEHWHLEAHASNSGWTKAQETLKTEYKENCVLLPFVATIWYTGRLK